MIQHHYSHSPWTVESPCVGPFIFLLSLLHLTWVYVCPEHWLKLYVISPALVFRYYTLTSYSHTHCLCSITSRVLHLSFIRMNYCAIPLYIHDAALKCMDSMIKRQHFLYGTLVTSNFHIPEMLSKVFFLTKCMDWCLSLQVHFFKSPPSVKKKTHTQYDSNYTRHQEIENEDINTKIQCTLEVNIHSYKTMQVV